MRQITNYGWAVTMGLTGLGWLWVLAGERGVTQEKLTKLESRVGAVQSGDNRANERLAEIQMAVTQLQTDVAWIREELRRLRDN